MIRKAFLPFIGYYYVGCRKIDCRIDRVESGITGELKIRGLKVKPL